MGPVVQATTVTVPKQLVTTVERVHVQPQRQSVTLTREVPHEVVQTVQRQVPVQSTQAVVQDEVVQLQRRTETASVQRHVQEVQTVQQQLQTQTEYVDKVVKKPHVTVVEKVD